MLVIVNTDFQGPTNRASRSKRGQGNAISAREHLRNTMCYITKRNDERWVQQPEFTTQYPDFMPGEASLYSFGLSCDWREAWEQIEATASDKVTYRTFDISPNTTLIDAVPSELWESLTVELAVESLRGYCQKRHGNDDLKFMLAYHFATDKDGRPHPHAHVVTEGSIFDENKGKLVPFALYPEHLVRLKTQHDQVFSQQLDDVLGPEIWHPIYDRWKTDQEQQREAHEREQAKQYADLFIEMPDLMVDFPEFDFTEPSEVLAVPQAEMTGEIGIPDTAEDTTSPVFVVPEPDSIIDLPPQPIPDSTIEAQAPTEAQLSVSPDAANVPTLHPSILASSMGLIAFSADEGASGVWYAFCESYRSVHLMKMWAVEDGIAADFQKINNVAPNYPHEMMQEDLRTWNESGAIDFYTTINYALQLWAENADERTLKRGFLMDGPPDPFTYSIEFPEPVDEILVSEPPTSATTDLASDEVEIEEENDIADDSGWGEIDFDL